MATDYQKICTRDNDKLVATVIKHNEFLSRLYAHSTHFIFEMLQNAEDALARNKARDYSRTVTFNLSESELRFSHFGESFTEKDVEAICESFESTKRNTDAIGKFGIGFKSVYVCTDRPEIHSGDEHFVIENYIFPREIPPVNSEPGQTTIVLPFKKDTATEFDDIKNELSSLKPTILLFLHEIEEICWTIEGGPVGNIRRSVESCVLKGARQIRLSGSDSQGAQINQTWIVFPREVEMPDCPAPGYVEIAFLVANADDDKSLTVNRLSTSPLMVYFPTAVETNLGFLMQGPYQTTPSRDNIAESDWNAYLIKETAALLVAALREFRDEELLDAATLMTLPIDRQWFANGNIFEPLFSQVVDALNSESLIPTSEGLYVSGKAVRIPEFVSQNKLFNSSQLTQLSYKTTRDASSLFSEPKLIDEGQEVSWLSADINPEATPELFHFLRVVLEVPIVKAEAILRRIRPSFLQEQTDSWMIQLYTFLLGRFSCDFIHSLPIIRCEDGRHLEPYQNGKPQVYLPSDNWTGFPTIKRSLVKEEYIADFMKQIGISEPELVDVVVQNVLPKYSSEYPDVDDSAYIQDISLILAAWDTDSRIQKEMLREALQESFFVKTVDMGTREKSFARPGDVYMATNTLKELFTGIIGILIVDDSYTCLKGEDIRSVLESCDAARFLRKVRRQTSSDYSQMKRSEIRKAYGDMAYRVYNETYEDWDIQGLLPLLLHLSDLSKEDARKRTSQLWKALADLKNHSFFTGRYIWRTNSKFKYRNFDSLCTMHLKQVPWVPDESGELQVPAQIEFEVPETSWGWERNEALQQSLGFKPSVIKELEKEANIEDGVIARLQRLNLITHSELDEYEKVTKKEVDAKKKAEITARVDSGATIVSREAKSSSSKNVPVFTESDISLSPNGKEQIIPNEQSKINSALVRGGEDAPFAGGTRVINKAGNPSVFVSYLAVSHIEEEQDPDGLELEERLQLEEQALKLIIDKEPELQRTPPNNPGFDLYENGPDGSPVKWIEVKSMTKSLKDRPVGISRTQFHAALNHGEDYWLYVVEYASEPDKARIIRIQDPAGKAFSFTFDFGWLDIADID